MPNPQERAKSLFLSALEVPDGEPRRALVAAACGGDEGLREEVEQLLRHHEAGASFLEPPQNFSAETSDLSPPAASSGRDAADRAGALLAGRYKLVEAIGEGGMGTVWMAQQTEPVRRLVAVKLIKAGMDTRAVLARFEAERQALALMDHPNIAKVLDAGETADGRPFFVMELVKGLPITEFCDARTLTVWQRLELFVSVCQAVQHAHQKGIIHRDLKPSNVLVALYDERPVPKVIDFGVAKAAGQQLTERTLATGFGAVVGTPEYMSPEQASFNNLDVDTRSDVYSLGVLLYELLAGSPPFGGAELRKAGLLELLRVVREAEPLRPSARLSTADTLPVLAANRRAEPARLTQLLRGELDWIVMRCLEKDRARRYDTANALARDVQRFLADEVVEARPPSRLYRLRRVVRRNRGALAVAGAFLLVLVAAVVVSTREAAKARADREELRVALTRQAADRIQADVLRLAVIGDALAATVEQGDTWDEKRFVAWMSRILESEPEILGLCIAFEPGTFAPAPDPATAREPFRTLLPLGLDALDPFRDGYSLYVRRRNPGLPLTPAAEELKREYRYRTQGWYANTLRGDARGWEEPTPDLHGEMVSYTTRLYRRGDRHPIGVLCVDLSVAYFDRLDSWLKNPSFGAGSYGFLLSEHGKVISHPHVRRGGPNPFPNIDTLWSAPAFEEPVRRMLAHTGDEVGRVTADDPATGRRSQFLFTRFKPANWVFVAVIPEDGG